MSLPTAYVTSATAGVFIFHVWEGQILPKRLEGETFTRLGQIGSGVQLTGSLGVPSPIRAYYLTTTDVDASNVRALVLALRFTYVNVVEPDGASWTGALVKECTAKKGTGFYNFGGTVYPICVTCDFIFEAQ